MASLQDLIKKAQQSRLGKAIGNLKPQAQQVTRSFERGVNNLSNLGDRIPTTQFVKGQGQELYRGIQSAGQNLGQAAFQIGYNQQQNLPTFQNTKQSLIKGGISAGKTIAYPLAGLNPGTYLAQSGLSGAINKATGGSFMEGAVQGASTAGLTSAFIRGTNPIINKGLSKLPVRLPSQVTNRIAPATGNIAQGVGLDLATGNQTTPLSVGIDAISGLAGGRTQFGKAIGKGVQGKPNMHPQDASAIDAVVDALRNKKLSKQEKQQAITTLDRLSSTYLTKPEIDSLRGSQKSLGAKDLRIARELQKRAGSDYDFGGYQLGLVGGSQAKSGKPNFSSVLDKKPRFEIDDSGAKIKLSGKLEQVGKRIRSAEESFDLPRVEADVNRLNSILESGDYKLGDILEHKNLYKNYPSLKDVSVQIDSTIKPGNGSFDASTKTITLSPNVFSQKSTLLHEIQHAIQEIEGFASGGSPRGILADQLGKDGKKLWGQRAEEIKFLKDKFSFIGGDVNNEQQLRSFIERVAKERDDSIGNSARRYLEISKKIGSNDGFGDYKRLSGELESRAVQRRMDMPQSQRAAVDPYSAEAIATTGTTNPNDFITRFDSGVQASQPTKGVEAPTQATAPKVEAKEIEKQLQALSDSKEFQDFYKGGKISGKSWNEYQRLSREYSKATAPKGVEATTTSSSKLQPGKIQSQGQAGLEPSPQATALKTAVSTSQPKTLRQQLKAYQGKKLGVKATVAVKGTGSSSKVILTRDNKYAFNINKKTLRLDKEASKKMDAVVETMRPVLEKNKGKTLTKQEIVEGGRKAKVLQDVVGRDEAKAFAESLQASRNLLLSESSQVGITPKFLEQLEIVSSTAADAGRRLQSFNIGAEDITIKERVLGDVLKAGATAEEILEAGRKIDWNNAEEITAFYRKFKPATIAEKLDEFRYTNMLSSPNTHINNTFSNFIQTAVLAPVEKTIRGTLSFAESRLTGKEQDYFAGQGVDFAKGYWKSLPDAWTNLKNTLSTDSTLTKPDVNLIPTSNSKFRKLYTTPLRALEASDQFFRTLVKGGEMESLKRQGITGAKAAKMAERQADYRTFRQAFDPDGKLGQNKVLQVWDKWNSAIGNLRNVPGGKYLVPFLQTPTNILKQGLEYSPLGFSTVPGASDPMGQLSKAVVGSTVFAGAYAMANSGLTTWDAPTNSTEKSEFYAAGLQPYSVKIGDKWVSYSKLGPLAYPIAMASALKWSKENNGDEGVLTTAGTAMAGTLGFFADQSYVRGIGDIIDAFRGDEYKQARGLGNIPSQMVPYRAFMGWISRLVDPVYRDTAGGSVPEQIGKSIVSQIPYASKSLPARETPFGGESQRQFPGINAVSPFSISQEKPEEKAFYDARKGMRDETKKANKIIEEIDESSVSGEVDTSKLLGDQAIKVTKKKLEAGMEVTPQELEAVYLSKATSMPSSNRYEKSQRDSELWSKSGSIMDDENLSEAQKRTLHTKIAQELGVSEFDLEVYSVAKQDNDDKTLYAYDQFDTMNTFDERMKYLVNGRKPVNGQILVSDGVIDNLVDDGVIPYALGKELKNIDLDSSGKVKSGKGKARGKASTKDFTARKNALNQLGEDLKKVKIGSGKIRATSGGAGKINTKALTFSGR
jgi:hypothetical protein